MTLQQVADICGCEMVLAPDHTAEITAAYTSDLLSDVMAHCPEGAVLITVQNHKNAVAVCTLVGAPAIWVAHGREIPDDMLEVARREGVALLRSPDSQFAASCKIGAALGSAGAQTAK